ncbi:short chain dehydrogenase [Chloropicon primus]|uniref:Short-chain dehydrogenase/reductase 3 n=2 Tax=Chloropicon primus TaxID=1764295 RepID=A0A5B8MMQ4_9CHLO|nr:short chain dehydrogenase [Chloropicon primus]UPR00106.1 short chain dehydrogenase [Chloropicon primus]|eukprot:QDZ20895.1 short chain dehydrogenase [Chloropicon primus]
MGVGYSCCQSNAIGPALDERFSGKRVVITGATSGIGLRLAKRLAASGAEVVGWGRNEDAMEDVHREASEKGWSLRMMRCDVSSREEIQERAAEVLAAFEGAVDILVNNAGVTSGGKWITDLSDEEINRCVDVNLLAHFWTVRAFLPSMIKRDSGHVVTVSSVAGIMGVAGLSDYCASKFGAFGLTESLRFELSKINSAVGTTIVCPSYVDNGMGKEAEVKCSALFPLMDEEYVVRRIMGAVARRQALVILPGTIRTTYLARMYPVSVYDRIVRTWANV